MSFTLFYSFTNNTYDPIAGQGLLYVDGVLVETWVVGAGVGNGTDPITIGNRADNATDANAKFDNVRIWSGVRTASDILANKDLCLTGTEPGLEILYNMEEGTGTVLNDLATNNGIQDGNIIGSIAWNLGTSCTPLPAAIDFDGVNDFISSPLDADKDVMLSTTWEAWVYPTTNDGNWRMLFSMEDGGWDRFVAFNVGNIYVGVSGGGWNPTTMVVNQWQHIAVVFTPGDVKFYLNGVEFLYGSDEGTHLSGGLFTVGANESGTQNFQGTLDEVRVWDIARTKTQIQNNMNCSFSVAQTNLVLNYTFDEGIANANNTAVSIINDLSGSLNNGTPNNFTQTGTNSNWVANVTTLNPVASVTVNAGVTSVCEGTSVTFTATPTNGGITPSYQWKKNGNNVGIDSINYIDSTLISSDVISCVLTSSIFCANTPTSNTVSITIINTPTVTISGATSICSGTGTSLTAGGAISYTWSPMQEAQLPLL